MTTTLVMHPNAGNVKLITATGTLPIRDVVLDGNTAARGWPGGYAWEGSALLWLSNGTFDIDRVTLRDSAGDGISILANSTVTIDDVTATDCFRGAVTITGGNTVVTIDNLQGSWFQIEKDHDGTGGVSTIVVTMTNSTLPEGVELESWGAVTVSHCDLGKRFWIYGEGGAPVRITDCIIGLTNSLADFPPDTTPEQADVFGRSIYYGRDVVFTRCHFTGPPLVLYPDILGLTFSGQRITYDACTFTGSGPQAIYNYGDSVDRGNVVEFKNGCTYTGFDAGYALRPGYHATLVGSLAPA